MRLIHYNTTREGARAFAYMSIESFATGAELPNATEELVSADTNGEQKELYTLITDATTRARVLLIPDESGDSDKYTLAVFEPDEWGNYTLPYKNIPKYKVGLIIRYAERIRFLKPMRSLSLDEADTPKFEAALNDFFGMPTFRSTGDNGSALPFAMLPVPVLSELTGIPISNADDYVRAVAAQTSAEAMPTEMQQAAKNTYYQERSALFLKWVLYEFMRVERYDHLKECLSQYGRFGLTQEWESACSLLNGLEPDLFIIANYLGHSYGGLRTTDDRALSAETGVPLQTIIKAKKTKIWVI